MSIATLPFSCHPQDHVGNLAALESWLEAIYQHLKDRRYQELSESFMEMNRKMAKADHFFGEIDSETLLPFLRRVILCAFVEEKHHFGEVPPELRRPKQWTSPYHTPSFENTFATWAFQQGIISVEVFERLGSEFQLVKNA